MRPAFRISRLLGASLALRWVLGVITTAGLGIGALLLVTEAEMKFQVGAQAESVHQLAAERLAQQADARIALVRERLHGLFSGLEQNLQVIAGLRSTQAALRSQNDVRIAEEVGSKLRQVGFSGAIMLDKDLRVIGADHTGASLIFANDSLHMHELKDRLADLVRGRGNGNAGAYRFAGVFDPSLAAILLTAGDGHYGLVLGVPVFDDFGDTLAVVLAYRVVQHAEPVLQDFARITGSDALLMFGERMIAATGEMPEDILLRRPTAAGLYPVPERALLVRCRKDSSPLTICVSEPEATVTALSSQIMSIGRRQFEKSRTTLLSVGLLALCMMLLTLVLLGRRLARPLSEIAGSVGQVAQGAWKVEVPHAERADEVGQIARALVQLQLSMAERDRMRIEMARINEINSHRLVMETAVVHFEDRMAVVMKDISASVRALASTNAVLDEAARRAEGNAERIRSTSLASAHRATSISLTTEHLMRSIRTIGERVRNTTDVVHRSETQAQRAEAQVGAAQSATLDVESTLGALQALVADLGNLGLRATLEAMEAGEAGSRFAPLARSVSELSARAAASADLLGAEVHNLSNITGTAGEAISEVRGVLGDALRETSEIAVTISEQDAATREIVEGLANSAQALAALAEAVEGLRLNMASAQEASGEFVASARRMAEDAKAIDGSVRNFVREVVA